MLKADKQAFIRRIVHENPQTPSLDKVLWSRHAVQRLRQADLRRQQVEQSLADAEVIEEYPVQTRPLPDCLVLAFIAQQTPIHAVVALDVPSDRILLVTVYRPTRERWQDDWKTRK